MAEETDPAPEVVPEALAVWSTAAAPAAVDSPLYSIVVIAAEAADETSQSPRGRCRRCDRRGPDALLGLIRSDEVAHFGEGVARCVGHARRLGIRAAPDSDLDDQPVPGTRGADGVTEMLAADATCVLACCTKTGTVAADGVTALDGDDG